MPRPRVTRALFAASFALVAGLYALAPAHRAGLDDLLGFVVPRHGAVSAERFLSGWVSRGTAALLAALVGLALLGAGGAARSWLDLRAGLARTWLLGFAPLSLALLGLGLCGLWFPAALGGVLGLCALAVFGSPPPALPRRDAWIAAAPCLVALPSALLPEVVFDALRYHLALPDAYLAAHRVVPVERCLFGSYPQGMEMVYGAALAFGTTVTAKLVAWACFPAAAAMLHHALARRLPRGQAFALTAAFAGMPFLSGHAATAGVDLPLIALELGGALWMLEALDGDGGRGAWRAAGWLFGAALGVKYLAVYGLGTAGLALFAAVPRRFAAAARAGLPVALGLFAAWPARNWLLTGDPVHPYGPGHWGLEPATYRLHLAWVGEWLRENPVGLAWATAPARALTRGIYDGLDEAMAPALFLAPLAVALARPADTRGDRFLLAFAALLYAVWLRAAGGIYRYLGPFYPVALLAGGRALARIRDLPPRAVTAALWIAAACQVPPLLAVHSLRDDPAGVMLGAESEREFVNRVVPPRGRYLPALARAAALGGGRLYLLGDPKSLYAPGSSVTDFEFAPGLIAHLAEISPDAARMRVRLRQRGVGPVLVWINGAISEAAMRGADAAPSPAAVGRLQAFWRDYGDPAWTDEHPAEQCFYHAFRLRRAPAPFQPPTSLLWYAPPGLEATTLPLDRALDAGRYADVVRLATDLLARDPTFAPALDRRRRAERALGQAAGAARDETALRRLGFAALRAGPVAPAP